MSFEAMLEAAEESRRARKAKLREAYAEQRAKDLAALADCEAEHGDSRVAHIDVPHTPGLPTLIAVRCASEPELKRYRFRLKPSKDGEPGDSVGAAEEVADCCVCYPPPDVYSKLRAERPGIHAQAGAGAISLAVGKQADEGKG